MLCLFSALISRGGFFTNFHKLLLTHLLPPGCHKTSLAKCFPSTCRTSCDFLTDYLKFSRVLTPYKVPQTVSLICSAFSGDWSWEETASVIQCVGSERVNSHSLKMSVVMFVVHVFVSVYYVLLLFYAVFKQTNS